MNNLKFKQIFTWRGKFQRKINKRGHTLYEQAEHAITNGMVMRTEKKHWHVTKD